APLLPDVEVTGLVRDHAERHRRVQHPEAPVLAAADAEVEAVVEHLEPLALGEPAPLQLRVGEGAPHGVHAGAVAPLDREAVVDDVGLNLGRHASPPLGLPRRTATPSRGADRRRRPPQPSCSSTSPRTSARRSSLRSCRRRLASIHSLATPRPPSSSRQTRTRPSLLVLTSRASSSTLRCCSTAATVTPRGSASAEAEAGPWLRRSTMALLVASPRASKTAAEDGR